MAEDPLTKGFTKLVREFQSSPIKKNISSFIVVKKSRVATIFSLVDAEPFIFQGNPAKFMIFWYRTNGLTILLATQNLM